MNEQRLIDLETKFSHQDVLIEELRQTVQSQYLTIEKLKQNFSILNDKLKRVDESMINPIEKPPHY